ncbi:hypothetical protein [Neolewinella antarctica]|uniref:Uncharacterized protein n=1 Tax=Neolewinella antarctica TaxID=442734 RepID=A0ABX0X7F8_9BACT|nr:hypothetical protein [Neolewinella antarctica]NJC25167.1 hypothetical protein [Neolewinella antarctica]
MANAKSIFSTVVVLFLLVGLPAISFYYLRTGFTYRKEAIMTQGDFGKMPDLSALTRVQGTLPDNLRGSMAVVGWLDPTKQEATRVYGHMMDSLYQQFADSPNLHFTTIVLSKDPDQTVNEFTQTYHLPEAPMLSFVRADATAFQRSASDFQLPLSQYDAPGTEPIVALVDSSQTIVKHYNLARRDETIGLVQLISVIIPLPEKQDLILDRGREL